MQWRLSPYAMEAVALCNGGWHPMQWRLAPYAMEAVALRHCHLLRLRVFALQALPSYHPSYHLTHTHLSAARMHLQLDM